VDGAQPPERHTALRRPASVALIANFSHVPNQDAAHWLVHEVMPLVWALNEEMVCVIAGGDMPAKLATDLARSRVRLLGHVPDLSGVYADCSVAVAPLRFGAGIKGKVLEAFAAGLPCVMTPIAAEGLPLPQLLKSAIAHDAVGLADAICRLHADPQQSARLVEAASAMLR
jgi:glycosyltransferase involved in cell wall biosynthesis